VTALTPEEERRCYPWVMAAAILGSTIAFIDGSIVGLALPAIREGLGAQLVQMQWVVNVYTLMLAAFILPGGAAGDVFGRKRIFLIGVAIYSFSSLWAGLARSPGELILARGVEGFGGAMMIPASLALITANVPEDRRGAAIGLWSAASAAAMIAGPILGGILIDLAGWRPALLLPVPIGALTFWIARHGVPESRGDAGRMDWIGGVLICAALGAIAIWLTALSAGAPVPVWWPLAGGGLLVAFLLSQARLAHPMLPLGLFRVRAFAVANAQTFLIYGALAGALTFLPLVLVDAHGYAAAQVGMAMTPFALLVAALSRFSGGLLDRYGARPMLILGPLLTGAGFAMMARVGPGGAVVGDVLPSMILLGLGMGLTAAPISTAAMNAVDSRRAGLASGANNAISRAAGLGGVPGFAGLGQIGVRRIAPEGVFGQPATIDPASYDAAMGQGLVWIAWGSAAVVWVAVLLAVIGLPRTRRSSGSA
jgi:EmrB/QacA subfamily drug resistance transporter